MDFRNSKYFEEEVVGWKVLVCAQPHLCFGPTMSYSQLTVGPEHLPLIELCCNLLQLLRYPAPLDRQNRTALDPLFSPLPVLSVTTALFPQLPLLPVIAVLFS